MKELAKERIIELVNACNMAKTHLYNGIMELREMHSALETVTGDPRQTDPFRVSGEFTSKLDVENGREYLLKIDQLCWRNLLDETDITVEMTAEDRFELCCQISRNAFGEFSEDNIPAKLQELNGQREIFRQQIYRKVYRLLNPNYHWKPLISGNETLFFGTMLEHFQQTSNDDLNLIEKAFLLLDGKPLPTEAAQQLAARMQEAVNRKEAEFECDYFHATIDMKVQLVRLVFKRPDLIEKINKAGIEK